MPTEHTQSKATHFLPPFSLLSTNNSSRLVCLFNYFVHAFISSFFAFLSVCRSLCPSLSPCLTQVISPPGANLAVIDPLISSALECQRNKTVVLTTPIKRMTVIKNHTSIICAVDISNGERVISGGSLFQTLTQIQIIHAIHTAEKVKST